MNVKQLCIIALLVLAIVSGYHYGYEHVVWQTSAAVTSALFTNLAIEYIKNKKIKFSKSAIITGLIIAMVAAPNSPILVISFLSFIAIVSKFVIKINNRTLFNPAALSLLIGVIAFKLPLGWWGDYNHFLTIAMGAILLIKYNGHWKMVYAFIITLTLLTIIESFIINGALADKLFFNIGICFFFTFFMLTDPRTSPLLADQHLTFAIITAIGSFVSILFYPSTIFLGGLLMANLITPYLNHLSLKKIKAKIPTKVAF